MITSSPGTADVHRGERRNGNPRARRIKLFAISLAAAVVGVCAVGSADADTPERGRVEVLELKIQNEQQAATDLGPAGPSLGDMDVYSGSAIRDGRRVGRGGGSCQVIHVNGKELTTQCLITIELERGSLTMQSLWGGGKGSLDMAITGGTGIYRNARGTARYWDIATPNERLRAEILH
ncbi:hypothetical protein ACIRPT_23905 [Streptomyces sp. NPDC101227]|uniref:allene oxide cyclase barrel-like domain-containing protein n=1 Tax=Streptomyces sp. NPDC101227 TaxID=3366136 RepID=UPI0037F7FE7B